MSGDWVVGWLFRDAERRAGLVFDAERRATLVFDAERRATLVFDAERRARLVFDAERRARLVCKVAGTRVSTSVECSCQRPIIDEPRD